MPSAPINKSTTTLVPSSKRTMISWGPYRSQEINFFFVWTWQLPLSRSLWRISRSASRGRILGPSERLQKSKLGTLSAYRSTGPVTMPKDLSMLFGESHRRKRYRPSDQRDNFSPCALHFAPKSIACSKMSQHLFQIAIPAPIARMSDLASRT